MTKLIGTGNNQVSTNGMLGGMAFQSPEDVQVDKLQEQRYNVVTQQDIGTAPNQVPINGFLGSLAYLDSIQGIDFSPSTGTGTATSNILDDYEEGTWTVSDAEGSNPVTSNVSWYVKVGSLVHIRASVNIGTTSSTSRISLTLPFNSNNASYYAGEGCIGYTTYTGATPRPVIENGGTRMYFYNENSINLMTWQNFSGKRIDFSVTYQRT